MKKLLTLAGVAVSVCFASVSVSAPQYDEEWHYYETSAKIKVVGGKDVSCYRGARYWGERTPHSRLLVKLPCYRDPIKK